MVAKSAGIRIALNSGDNSFGYTARAATSFSAPMVARAAGLVKHMWPFLTAVEVGQLLLDTADKSHADYNRPLGDGKCSVVISSTANCGAAKFGSGFLDLNAALKYQGPLVVATSTNLQSKLTPIEQKFSCFACTICKLV